MFTLETPPPSWERQRSAFFDVRVCHPYADSYRDLDLKQKYKQHENNKKRLHRQRVMDVEQGTFAALVSSSSSSYPLFKHDKV